MTILAELAPVGGDACPQCHPGDSPCLPVGDPEPVTGGMVADYECDCGTAWTTAFDEFGWPLERSIAIATPERRAA